MFEMLTINKESKINSSDYTFNIPTKFSKESPIFILNFSLENNAPSVTVNLYRELSSKTIRNKTKATFKFNDDGVCQASHEYPEGYYISGELELDPDSNESPNDNYCKMKIDYGKYDSESLFIKGSFNLNDFSK